MECQDALGFQLIHLHNLIESVWSIEYCYSWEYHFKMDQDDGDLLERVGWRNIERWGGGGQDICV